VAEGGWARHWNTGISERLWATLACNVRVATFPLYLLPAKRLAVSAASPPLSPLPLFPRSVPIFRFPFAFRPVCPYLHHHRSTNWPLHPRDTSRYSKPVPTVVTCLDQHWLLFPSAQAHHLEAITTSGTLDPSTQTLTNSPPHDRASRRNRHPRPLGIRRSTQTQSPVESIYIVACCPHRPSRCRPRLASHRNSCLASRPRCSPAALALNFSPINEPGRPHRRLDNTRGSPFRPLSFRVADS
jgi:hypothetical protein